MILIATRASADKNATTTVTLHFRPVLSRIDHFRFPPRRRIICMSEQTHIPNRFPNPPVMGRFRDFRKLYTLYSAPSITSIKPSQDAPPQWTINAQLQSIYYASSCLLD